MNVRRSCRFSLTVMLAALSPAVGDDGSLHALLLLFLNGSVMFRGLVVEPVCCALPASSNSEQAVVMVCLCNQQQLHGAEAELQMSEAHNGKEQISSIHANHNKQACQCRNYLQSNHRFLLCFTAIIFNSSSLIKHGGKQQLWSVNGFLLHWTYSRLRNNEQLKANVPFYWTLRWAESTICWQWAAYESKLTQWICPECHSGPCSSSITLLGKKCLNLMITSLDLFGFSVEFDICDCLPKHQNTNMF